ncbi:Carbon-nitrogen hydrolase [Sorochytrium milnesiophthora]
MKSVAAVVQMCSTHNVSANLAAAVDLIRNIRAASTEVSAVFFPESTDFIAENSEQSAALAQPLDGPFVTTLQQQARDNKLTIFVGVHEKIADGHKKTRNCLVAIDSKGNIADVYRKLHLFDIDSAKTKLKESDACEAGTVINKPLATSFGNVGMAICYDVRFSELAIKLRKQGADILLYPSAFTVHTGQAHWEPLLRARAIETQCHVIAAAQVGEHNSKRKSYGHAMAIDPFGRILADCGDDPNKNTFKLFDIDPSVTAEIRDSMPVLEHRRDDVYDV